MWFQLITVPKWMGLPVLALIMAQTMLHVAGQGLNPAKANPLGSSQVVKSLQQVYGQSKRWRAEYKVKPMVACSKGTSSLCGSKSSSNGGVSVFAQLLMATSPNSYSSIDARDVHGRKLVSTPQKQGECEACVGFAVAAAAETALATTMYTDVSQTSISVQGLFFCSDKGIFRGCKSGWNLADAVSSLRDRAGSIPIASCLKYNPDISGVLTRGELCQQTCTTVNPYVNRGSIDAKMINYDYEAQAHILRYGAIVSRFDIYNDFKTFFDDPANAKKVYMPNPRAKFVNGHAVVLVGYDNEGQFWLAKNSWGSDWADGGYFRVAFNVCSILSGNLGEAYGITFETKTKVDAAQLPVTCCTTARDSSDSGAKKCYWYTARMGDYVSGIALRARIPVEDFLYDNVDIIRDLDKPLEGLKLRVCNPSPGYITVGSTLGRTGEPLGLQPPGPVPGEVVDVQASVKPAINGYIEYTPGGKVTNLDYKPFRRINAGQYTYIVYPFHGDGIHDYRRHCQQKGGDLVSILTEGEQRVVTKLVSSAFGKYRDSLGFTLYIGLKWRSAGSTDAGSWEWMDGSLMQYSNWDVSQPNSGDQCVALMLASGRWATTSCTRAWGSSGVCKLPLQAASPSSLVRKPGPRLMPSQVKNGTIKGDSYVAIDTPDGILCFMYGLESKGLKASQGQAFCKEHGGDLAVLKNANTWELVRQLLYNSLGSEGGALIGLEKRTAVQKSVWMTDGSTVTGYTGTLIFSTQDGTCAQLAGASDIAWSLAVDDIGCDLILRGNGISGSHILCSMKNLPQ